MSESLTSELWLKIDQLHLKYLQSEDNPLKLDIRKKLEGLVADYLSIVPQQRKFVSAATGDIISNSAKWKPDFSLVKAAQAFRAIEQYAANLINQPWRQEFWNIRQYSGFYKHSVETALFGAEKMFMDMGYSPSPGQAQVLSLAQPRVGEHPVNIDMVTSVARDCVLACVECHLLAEVHNTVSAQFPTVLEEVIDFRRDHIGSIDVCTRELVYRKNQLRFQFPSPMTNPQYGIQNFAYPAPPQPVPAPVSNYQPQQTNGYTPAAYPAAGPVYGYPEFPMGGPQASVGQCYGPPPPGVNGQHVAMERLSAGQHSHHSPAGSSSTCTMRQIPTTILELAGSGGGGSGGHEPVAPQRRDRAERERDRDRESGARPREHKDNGKSNGRSRKSGVEQDFDSWDYVYKHLEQTGYTKDQAERPDVLDSSQSQSDEELRRNIQGLRLRETRNGDSGNRNGDYGGHRNGDTGHGGHRNNGQRSRHNGSIGGGRHQEQEVRDHHYKGHNRYSRVETSESEQEQDHSRYSSALSEDTLQPQRQPRGGGQRPQSGGRGGGAELWECITCTYHNKQSTNICEMCSKSRDFQPVQETRSVEPARAQERASGSGRKMSLPQSEGTACTKCTLVNPASNKLCDACGATLPKY